MDKNPKIFNLQKRQTKKQQIFHFSCLNFKFLSFMLKKKSPQQLLPLCILINWLLNPALTSSYQQQTVKWLSLSCLTLKLCRVKMPPSFFFNHAGERQMLHCQSKVKHSYLDRRDYLSPLACCHGRLSFHCVRLIFSPFCSQCCRQRWIYCASVLHRYAVKHCGGYM